MKFQSLGMIACLALFTAGQPIHVQADEAQAALVGTSASRGYTIPEHLGTKEKEWYRVFQEGNFLADGWLKISADILAKTPADKHPAQRLALENLGRKIGLEWCRNNDVRKVDTAMIQDWGGLLRRTAKTHPERLGEAIASIDEEVDSVLD